MGAYFFESLFPNEIYLRHYSLARHALVDAFRVLGLNAGDKVLLPEYICRDLLASLYQLGLKPVWYSVGCDLAPDSAPHQWPTAKTVLAINYFGFPQNLAPFDEYAQRTGATIIEDNAHGLLSRDQAGCLLGMRRSLGLLSYRKTFLLGRGAGLVINPTVSSSLRCAAFLPEQLEFTSQPMPLAVSARRNLRRFFGTRAIDYSFAILKRRMRRLLGKNEIPVPSMTVETHLPGLPNPDLFLIPTLDSEGIQTEIERRRSLYFKLAKQAKECDVKLLFPNLPDNTVPYGLPVYGANEVVIAQLAREEQLDYFKWPDLPKEISDTDIKHYSNIYLINFL
jgi:hypothetical protein